MPADIARVVLAGTFQTNLMLQPSYLWARFDGRSCDTSSPGHSGANQSAQAFNGHFER